MIIDTDNIEGNLSLEELSLLLLLYAKSGKKVGNVVSLKMSDIEEIFDKMKGKGLCGTGVSATKSYSIRNIGATYLSNLENREKEEKKTDDRCVVLADKLKQLYPDGKKPGTTFFWKDSTTVIAERLKKFFLKYGEHTDEEIIDATKRYVKSFNGDYRYMQLLKYFIWKNKTSGGELIEGRLVGEVERQSQLAAYIENKDESSPTFHSDWDITLR